MTYYRMSKNTCYLCMYWDGMKEDGTPGMPAFKKCDHLVEASVLDMEIKRREDDLKELKKARRYAKKEEINDESIR